MKCRMCNTNFDPSAEEYAHAREEGKPTKKDPRSYTESFLPKFCCWECCKKYNRYRFHGHADKEQKAKEKNRWLYHIGDKDPRAGSPDARREEELYRQKMAESCSRRPPKVGHSGFSENMVNHTELPSTFLFGKPEERVLDESAIHLGGEDGEKFNFVGE